jgi:hypothetical protein
MRRIITLVLAVTLALGLVSGTKPATAAVDKLPDLGMARLGNPYVDKVGTQFRLRFDATIVNVGTGPFEVLGSRDSSSDTTMDTVSQTIYDDAGGSRSRPAQDTTGSGAQMVFGGDGHNHWHVKNLEQYQLDPLSSSTTRPRTGAKSGFCFYDNARYLLTLPDAPQSPKYTNCGDSSSMSVTTGLSVGWGDLYPAILPDQYIDITGLPAGRYRLSATADPSDWFTESRSDNNSTYVDLQLQQKQKGNKSYSVTVLAYGPEAKDAL